MGRGAGGGGSRKSSKDRSLKPPGNAISETLNSKMSLAASVLKNLCLNLVRVPKPPTIHYQPTTSELFDSANSMLLHGTKFARNFLKTSKFLNVEFATRQMMIG